MAIFIGIDGGGTKTRLAIQQDDGVPEYSEYSISIKVLNGDFASSAQIFRNIIAEVSTTLIGSFSSFKACPELAEGSLPETDHDPNVKIIIALGLSGMSGEEDQIALKTAIMAFPEFESAKIHIESDATMTLKAVLPEGEEGILLIAGTGSVVFYQPSGGPARRIGGWGPLLSDDGSGYRIGLSALRHYLLMLDGVFDRDALCEAMDKRILAAGIAATPKGLTERAERDIAFVASFAQDAFEAASNDPHLPRRRHVCEMLEDELMDLSTILFPLTIPGVMSGKTPYNLYIAGGVARQPFTIQYIEGTYEDYPVRYFNFHVVPDHAPAFKALEIAKTL